MAEHRHKRETNARRPPRAALVAAPLAVLATAGAVSLGVLTSEPSVPDDLVARDAAADVGLPDDEASDAGRSADRPARLSRSSRRTVQIVDGVDLSTAATAQAVRAADQKRWSTADLNLWETPDGDASQDGELAAGEPVLITGRTALDRVEIVVDDQSRWVTQGYLSEDKPFSLGGECTNGTTVDPGVSENIVKVHEAVCAAFPDITTYGTFRSDGEHAQGIAVDIMVSGDEGYAVRDFVQKYYAELGVNYIIYSQHIWSVDRASEGWRAMEDRGSITANHYDHVHVTVY